MVTRREFIKGIGKAFALTYFANDLFNIIFQLEYLQLSLDFFNPFYSYNSKIVERAIENKEIEITIHDINPEKDEKIDFEKLKKIIKTLDDFKLYINYEPLYVDEEIVNGFSKKINICTNKIKNLINYNNFKEARNISKKLSSEIKLWVDDFYEGRQIPNNTINIFFSDFRFKNMGGFYLNEFDKNIVFLKRSKYENESSIAHETGHALGLPHTIVIPDIMSYAPSNYLMEKIFNLNFFGLESKLNWYKIKINYKKQN